MSTAIRTLATEGLQAASRAPQQVQRRNLGDQCLDRIVASPEADDLEKAVASACRRSTMPKLYPSSALGAHKVALQALAAGVGGPAGPVLASLGEKALAGAYSQEDARHMSTGWLQAVEAHGTPSERLLARTARDTTALKLYHSTAVGAQKKALKALAAGLKGSDQQVLAQFGLDALAGAYNQEDQRTVGYKTLETLQSTVLGSAARAATAPKIYHSSGVAVQKKALQMLAAPTTPADPDAQLAALGAEAVARAYNQEDARTMGAALLGEFAKPGHAPVAQLLAAATRATAAQYLYHQSASGTMKLAFARIARGPGTDTPEAAVARLALDAAKVAYNEKDRRTLGAGFLQELGARSTEPRVQALVRYAQGSTPASDAEAVALQKEVFEALASGRSNLVLKVGGYGISVPLVDAKGDRAALEESVAHNRAVVAQAGAAEKDALGKMSGVQAEVTDLSARLTRAQEAAGPVRAGLSPGWRLARTVGGVSAALGFLAAAGVGGPIALAAGAAGAVVFGVTQFVEMRRDADRRRLQDEVYTLANQAALKTAELSGLRSRASGAREAISRAEEALREADKTLQVYRMAEAAAAPPTPGALEVEEETVLIGGIRIPRRSAGD